MRYQDRLLKHSPETLSAPLAQYLARETEALTVGFDAPAVLEWLEAIAARSPPAAAVQAVLARTRLHAKILREQYLPSCPATRSRLLEVSPLDEHPAPEPALAQQLTRQTCRRAMLMLAGPLVEPLLELLRTGSLPIRRRALCALGRLATKRALLSLGEVAVTVEDPLAPMAALLSATPGGDQAGALVVEAVRRHTGRESLGAVLLALGAAPTRNGLSFLGALAAIGPVDALACAAVAAEGFPPDDAEPFLERLCATGDGWTMVHAIESLGRLGSERALELLVRTFRRTEHPTLKAVCVKSVARQRTAAATDFLVKALSDDPPPAVAARALEGLVATTSSLEAYEPLFSAHLEDRAPEAVIAALLGLSASSRSRVTGKLHTWLVSSDPAWRAEAAYCLGYVQGDFSLPILRRLALGDLEESVRLAAIASLVLHEPCGATSAVLVRVLDEGDGVCRARAAAALGTPSYAEDPEVFAHLRDAYRRATDDGLAIAIARGLGRSGSRHSQDLLSAEAARPDLSAERRAGVLDGLDLGGLATRDVLEAHLRPQADPRVRAVAARALWNLGGEASVGVLADLLSSGGRDAEAALGEVERMAIVSGELVTSTQFAALRTRLKDAVRSEAYREFAAAEFSVHFSPDRLGVGLDPFGSSGGPRRLAAGEAGVLASGELAGEMERAVKRNRRRSPRPILDMRGLERRPSLLSPVRLGSLALSLLVIGLLTHGGYRAVEKKLAGTSPAAARQGPVESALQIAGLPGGATLIAPGSSTPARAFPGGSVPAGAVLASSAGRGVSLLLPGAKDRLLLHPGGRLKVGAVLWDRRSETVQVELGGLTGALFLRIDGPSTAVTLVTPAGRVIACGGQFLVRQSEESVAVMVGRGRAEVTRSQAGQVTTLTELQQLDWTRTSGQTVGVCDAAVFAPFAP